MVAINYDYRERNGARVIELLDDSCINNSFRYDQYGVEFLFTGGQGRRNGMATVFHRIKRIGHLFPSMRGFS